MEDIFLKKNCLVIAEAGVNHNGSLDMAKDIVSAAAESGADVVKFQAYNTGSIIQKNTELAEYQKRASGFKSQYEMLKRYELQKSEFEELKKTCTECGILFAASVFDENSADDIYDVGVPFFKLGSGEITNTPLISHIADFQVPLILSTGMSDIEEIKSAVETYTNRTHSSYALLHCTSAYPAPLEDINLANIKLLKDNFNCIVGYSDHSLYDEVVVAAVALGAAIIEKHFTLSKKLPGPDHEASYEPEAFKNMVEKIRNTEKLLGKSGKAATDSERDNMCLVRKSIFSKSDIKKGEMIKDEMIEYKRPGKGISPNRRKEIIGKKARTLIKKGRMIKYEDVE